MIWIELESAQTIFIDEVQRIPRILNTVEALLDKDKRLRFYLTGWSARKLKRGNANLLPGRVLNFKMGPLVAAELDYKMDVERALSIGTLPEAYLGNRKSESRKLIKSYVANYLKEEIKAEALTRSLESFARFLTGISLANARSFPKHQGLYIFHLGHRERKIGPVWALPWQKGLKTLGL